jgi:hypothetical protein
LLPPGTLVLSPILLQQPVVQRAASPPPPYPQGAGGFHFDPDESDQDSEEDQVAPPRDGRSLKRDTAVRCLLRK